ncbi:MULTISPECIES: 2OG-Fe(II) oxygenase family protein [Thiorhodovibrio]|uniref:2OG-Fe(II) oxygenase family protein n=1 Tax=Thiorhodovibrio TaxID=61593 RepID=UPI0019138D02|nr:MULTISPECIES: 2OG-Fe(II) oxygenase [Thiorhodovibrio]MBK5968132.1 2OG-Fe(II) oxygenase [Thiorhodovibrio winogradskyi]WPL13650.1 putative iron-regulated protein [Thiorhodovibrio litoralis]
MSQKNQVSAGQPSGSSPQSPVIKGLTAEHGLPPLQSIREVKPGSFIFARPRALPPAFCEEMIARFEANPAQQYEGRIGQIQERDRAIKQTMDLVVSNKEDWKDADEMFFRCLAAALREFRETFPYFKGPFKDMGYQIQRYQPGEFYHWHIDGGSHEFSQRQLVALWYLNDVPGPGGETQFLYQDISVRPEQGKLVLFPPFWTHEHRAARIDSGVKYIATTWVVFA